MKTCYKLTISFTVCAVMLGLLSSAGSAGQIGASSWPWATQRAGGSSRGWSGLDWTKTATGGSGTGYPSLATVHEGVGDNKQTLVFRWWNEVSEEADMAVIEPPPDDDTPTKEHYKFIKRVHWVRDYTGDVHVVYWLNSWTYWPDTHEREDSKQICYKKGVLSGGTYEFDNNYAKVLDTDTLEHIHDYPVVAVPPGSTYPGVVYIEKDYENEENVVYLREYTDSGWTDTEVDTDPQGDPFGDYKEKTVGLAYHPGNSRPRVLYAFSNGSDLNLWFRKKDSSDWATRVNLCSDFSWDCPKCPLVYEVASPYEANVAYVKSDTGARHRSSTNEVTWTSATTVVPFTTSRSRVWMTESAVSNDMLLACTGGTTIYFAWQDVGTWSYEQVDNPLGIAHSHPKYCLSIASEPHTGAPWVFVYCGYSNPNAPLAHCSRRFGTPPGDTAFHVDDCGYYTRDGTFVVDDRGAALLKGTLTQDTTPGATSGADLLVYGGTGGTTLVAAVEKSSGDMDIAGGLTEFVDPVTDPGPTTKALEFMGYDYDGNSNPDLVGYIDESGNMKLRGLFFDDNDLLNGLSWVIE